MSIWQLTDIVYPIIRWMHLVFTTLIVGGTLFFELVLPIAIEDMRHEDRLYVFARARWVFRWVVWIGTIGLIFSGLGVLYQNWRVYEAAGSAYVGRWVASHILLGILAMLIPLLLTVGRRPPTDPVRWMRLDLVILLVAIFLGSATRHFQIVLREQEVRAREGKVPSGLPPVLDGDREPDAGSSTRPATTRSSP
jgi:uncharacterized membrane protein